jgi:PKD repeat protein
VPFSPCLVENESIILPTKNGPVYLFDVETGALLANITLGKNTTLDEYWGIPKMSIADSIKIYTDCYLHGILPFRYNETSDRIEWNSEIPYGIMPSEKNYFIDFIHGKAFFTNQNFVTYKERVAPFTWENITTNEIQAPAICTGEGYFSTINSACVHGNMVYLATEYTKPGFWQYHIINITLGVNNTVGRLYAIKVNASAENESERLEELWNYTYFGKSQATPTLIGDTIYFDGYNNTLSADEQDPHIYAVYTNGTEKWKTKVDGVTTFTFTADPRGGIWYEDADQWPWRINDGNNKLFRYYEEDGSHNDTETIDMKTILNDNDYPNSTVQPCSDMTICGTPTYPIMLISANHPRFQEGKWVLAINLTTKTQIWNVSVPPYASALNLPWPYINHSLGDFNYAVGDYTILQWHNQSRILFPTYPGGMMAIGQYPNCSFETINYQPKDTFIQDPDNDAVQVNYTINSIIPDRVRVKVTLISSDHPILCSYKTESSYDVTTPASIQDSLTNILPPRAPKGYYKLRVDLYNSSGNMSFPRKANKTYQPNEQLYLAPPITSSQTPHQPIGETNVTTNTLKLYTTNTTDTNNFSIWYQWRYQTRYKKDGEIKTRYTTWILGGPHRSGENCTREIIWSYPGVYNISVHAKNVFLNPNVMSNWSENLTVNVTYTNGGGAAWNPDLLDPFTMDTIAVGQQTSCGGLAQGVIIDPSQRGDLNWTWDFGDGNTSWGENATHNYTQPGNYTIHLSIRDDTYILNSTRNITVLILNAGFQTTGDWKPDQKVIFNDTSAGFYPIVNWTWDFGDGNISYNQNVTHNYTTTGMYNVTLIIQDNQSNIHSIMHPVFVEVNPSELAQVTAIPKRVGPGSSVTINTDLLDNESGLREIQINITFPNNTTHLNTTMIHDNESVYDYSYVFNNTWQTGIYNYSIWTKDNANNTRYTQGFNFTVSANAAVNVCTVKDTFGPNEYINLTDPPGDPSPSLGYELLDDGAVLHLWNHYDNYYINTSNGIQLTNHKDEYWSHNVMMLGYYNNDQWHLLYRTDELTGFSRSIETDNSTYVNITLWKDLTYAGYPFRLSLRYHLGIDDNDLTIIPSIKNLGTNPIPYVLGFGWELNDIQINMTTEGDYIVVDQESYYLNQTLDNTYTDLNETVFYLMDDSIDTQIQSLYLRWGPDLTYKLQVKSRAGQQNAPVTLFIRIGTLAIGQQKSTMMHWYDASQVTYYYTSYNVYEAWDGNPENMVDGSTETFASTHTNEDLQVCNGNTCPGSNLGVIQKVELRAHCYKEGEAANITLQPMLEEDIGQNYTISPGGEPEWTPWFDITADFGHGSSEFSTPWTWEEIKILCCNVQSSLIDGMLFCSMVEIRVTYNTAPQISNPSPPHGANGVGLQPWLSINVTDPDEDKMNVTWYTNATSQESSTWMMFGSNSSVQNGTITQLFENVTENGKWWYWKVKVEDGDATTWSPIYKFYTGYQSKIENTGETNISGYLLMQVQYYDDFSEQWVLDTEVENQSTRQVVNISEQLGLDQFFNGEVKAEELTHGAGTYRVYVAFRNPEGNILRTDDDVELVSWWEFTKTE